MNIEDRRGFLAGGLALAGLDPGGEAAAQDGDAPARLGVVSIHRCLESYPRIKELEEELSSLKGRLAREGDDLREKIATINEDLLRTKIGDPLYPQRIRLRGHAEYDLKVSQEMGRLQMRDLALDHEARVMHELRRVVALVAKARRLQVVFRADERVASPDDPEKPSRAVQSAPEMLFHDAAVDITTAVRDRLIEEWKSAWVCKTCKKKSAGTTCLCGNPKP